MLVLQRSKYNPNDPKYAQETIVITVPPSDKPHRITVTVRDIKSMGRARIGIEADPEVKIYRGEVQAEIDAGK